MEHPVLLGFAAVLFVVGFGLMRWAGRYDAAGIATDAAWRMVKTGSTAGAKDELDRVIDEQLSEVRADAVRIGVARTAVKHGGRFFLARFANIGGIILMLIGVAAAAAAFLWT